MRVRGEGWRGGGGRSEGRGEGGGVTSCFLDHYVFVYMNNIYLVFYANL